MRAAITAVMMTLIIGSARAQPTGTTGSAGIPQRVILYSPVPLPVVGSFFVAGSSVIAFQGGSYTVTPGTNSPTLATQIAISTTLTAIKARSDLLATEATLATRGTESTQIAVSTNIVAIRQQTDQLAFAGGRLLTTEQNSVAISTTLTAIKSRADLLATEATLATRASEATAVAISTTVTAIKSRADLLGTEATLATRASESTLVAVSTTATAIKARADLLATEATSASISTTSAAILARANLLATEATLATRASESTQIAVSTTLAGIKSQTDQLTFSSTRLLTAEQNSVAISTTLTAIKSRTDLLATESTLAAISTQAAAINANTIGLSSTTTAILARANLLATEASNIAISTTSTAILNRANLLATEATSAAISTTNAAILARANLLATESTVAAISTLTVVQNATLVAISTTNTQINLNIIAISTLTVAQNATLVTISTTNTQINANTVAISTTNTAILNRANLLATDSNLVAVSTNIVAIRQQTDQFVFSGGRLNVNSSAVFQSSQPTLTSGSTAPFLLDQRGNLKVLLSSGTDNVGILNGRLLVDGRASASDNFYSVDAGTVNAATANADNGIILIVNPTGSGKTLYVQNRSLGAFDSAAHALIFRAYLGTIVTSSGTTLGIVKLPSTSAASVASAFFSPTFTIPNRGNLVDSFATASPGPPMYIPDGGSIRIAPGQNLMLTSYPDNANRVVDFSIKWTEQ